MHLSKYHWYPEVKPSCTIAYSLILTACGRWVKGFNVTTYAYRGVDCPRCRRYVDAKLRVMCL